MPRSPGELDHMVIDTSVATETPARMVTRPPTSMTAADQGEASEFTNRGGSRGRPPEGSVGTVGFRDPTGSLLVTAPSAPTADRHTIPGFPRCTEGPRLIGTVS